MASYDFQQRATGRQPETPAEKIKTIGVGIGEIKTSRNPYAVLTAYGVGSCISICVHDPLIPVAGMAHVLLPKLKEGSAKENRNAYADVAVPELVKRMLRKGAVKRRMTVQLAGGASVVRSVPHPNGDIGKRNIDEVKRLLEEMNMRIACMDVGGNHGRTIRFHVKTGEMKVSSARRAPKTS